MFLLGFAIAGFLLFVAIQPADYTISREIVIAAPAEKIFPHINNSEKANAWMPWAEEDPNVKMNYSGPAEGVGSISSWDSPGKMGTGNAEVVESVQNQVVKTKLTYTKPMEMTQLAEISLSPTASGGTNVRWSVSGKNSFVGRIFCIFMNMDKLVGGMFEKGLARLKTSVENLQTQ